MNATHTSNFDLKDSSVLRENTDKSLIHSSFSRGQSVPGKVALDKKDNQRSSGILIKQKNYDKSTDNLATYSKEADARDKSLTHEPKVRSFLNKSIDIKKLLKNYKLDIDKNR